MPRPARVVFILLLVFVLLLPSARARFAHDTGDRYVAAGWTDGEDASEGGGFGPWRLGGSGHRIATSLDAGGGANLGQSFGFGGTASGYARRAFVGGGLQDGETFSISLVVNFRAGFKGVSLNAGDTDVLALTVSGDDYTLDGAPLAGRPGATGDWSYAPDTVLALRATRRGEDLYVAVARTGGNTAAFATILPGLGAAPTGFGVYSFTSSPAPEDGIYFNHPTLSSGLITGLATDAARHDPGRPVALEVGLHNDTATPRDVSLSLYPRALGAPAGPDQSRLVTVPAHTTVQVPFVWSPPLADYRGYLLEVWARTPAGEILDFRATAADVSTNWTRFPRYGYLTKLHPSDNPSAIVDWLNKHHINGIQFYDWMDEHHRPHTASPEWREIARNTVSGATLRAATSAARERGMVSMAYNLMNGAYDNYWMDGSGVQLAWGLYANDGQPRSLLNQDHHPVPESWESARIYLFNPASLDWQNHLFTQMDAALADFGFDGWHIDTLGNRGDLLTWEGDPVTLDQTYAGFVAHASDQLQAPLLMNIVGDYGRVTVPVSDDLDFIYNELWHETDTDDYHDLKQLTESYWSQSGGKAVVYAAYMNLERARTHPGTFFNPHSVLLMDATVFASGASHLELGDYGRMLSDPYFPSTALHLSAPLATALEDYYHFATAYQTLLRGGATPVDYGVGLGGAAHSYLGEAGKVWTFARRADGRGVLHFINLVSATSTRWRDTHATCPPPIPLRALSVRVYHGGDLRPGAMLWWASPDHDHGKAHALNYTSGGSGAEAYIDLVLPRLDYWSMLWFDRETPGELWQRQALGDAAFTSAAAPTADPDGDGLPNLLERALGTDPLRPAATHATKLLATPEGLRFRHPRAKSAANLTVQVQTTTDLATGLWSDVLAIPPVIADDGHVEQHEYLFPPAPRRFFRLQVSP